MRDRLAWTNRRASLLFLLAASLCDAREVAVSGERMVPQWLDGSEHRWDSSIGGSSMGRRLQQGDDEATSDGGGGGGDVNTGFRGVCYSTVPFDETRHKDVYKVGVLAHRGLDEVVVEFDKTFHEYLTETAGRRFDPPIRFELVPLEFLTLFSRLGEMDFLHVNPSAFSCIESEFEALSLATMVSRRVVGGAVYDLKKFGGVIVTQAGRDDITSLQDLRDKVIAAASINGLGSGQLQFKRMFDVGLNYLQDPKQLVFTSDQELVIQGVAKGDFDVGFVRTDQLERTKDENGNLYNVSDFKVLEPLANLTIDGSPFPYPSSTELYAEWNIAALLHVDPQVSREVLRAMLSLGDFAKVGDPLRECYASRNTSFCDSQSLNDFFPEGDIRCDTTRETARLASEARDNGKYAGWVPSLSYMKLRSMQEATGFISMDSSTNTWRCVRSAELYDAISCPDGTVRKSEAEVDVACDLDGLHCGEGFQCLCRPCGIPEDSTCENAILMRGRCVSLALFLPCVVLALVLIVGVLVHFYVENKRKQMDSVWEVNRHDLVFGQPPQVIGKGTFGLVLLGEYRGTEVAIKRVIPPSSSIKNRIFDASNYLDYSNSNTNNEDSLEQGYVVDRSPGHTSKGGTAFGTGSITRRVYNNSAALQSMYMREADSSKRGGLRCRDRSNEAQRRRKTEFVREIRQLARLRHPCITTVMGAVIPARGGEPMLVMEYMEQGSLYDVLRNKSFHLKPEQILAMLQDVAQGLRFLHSADPIVIHGDLKSQNVLVDRNFCAKVTDFGLSAKKSIGAVGTPYWMAPELLNGKSMNTTSSDVYAYGILIYEIYSGTVPYEGERYDEVIRNICDPHIMKRPPVPNRCSPKVAKLMKECLSHNPEERPSADQLDVALKVELKVKERTTRLEQLNRDLEDANQRIASASALQVEHFACMSHEIRTPLNCIVGLSSFLKETELNPMQIESMDMIVTSGVLLRQIVDDVLDYSKLSCGKTDVLVSESNLQDILYAVVQMTKTSPVAKEKHLGLTTSYDPLLPEYVDTDSRKVQQILFNLLGNAVKFGKPNTDIELGVHIKDKILVLSVKNFGKGIEENSYEDIFEPFVQTTTGMTNTEGGTGLGLPITKKLTEALDGRISVNSVVDGLTEFTVEFPFHNLSVDRTEVATRLNGSTVILVAGESTPDTSYIIGILGYFNIDYVFFPTMADLAKILDFEGVLARKKAYVLLCQEDLYAKEPFDLLVAKAMACLVSFGPNFSVHKPRRHFQSLLEIFPSVLVSRFGDYVEEMKTFDSSTTQNGKSKENLGSEFSHLRVLIAEDNLVNQKVLTRILNRLGIECITLVTDGKEAVTREALESFDVCLMDMQMPIMDGISACREIQKRLGGHPRAKIVFVTAHVSDAFEKSCVENGAFGYLPKPCSMDRIKECLRCVTEKGEMYFARA